MPNSTPATGLTVQCLLLEQPEQALLLSGCSAAGLIC